MRESPAIAAAPHPLMAGNSSPGRRAKLLVVEDEAVVALDLAAQLDELGYDIVGTADNGADALAMAHQHRPDLVLMDVVIKGNIDGIEAAALLTEGTQIPVVFLTAFNDAATLQRAVLTAPYGYITKPFQINELRATIDVALYKSRLEKQLRASEQWFASALRCVGDAVVAMDNRGLIQFLNPRAEKTFGIPLDQAIGQPASELIRFDAPVGDPQWTTLDPTTVQSFIGQRLVTAQNQSIPVDASIAPILGDAGELLGRVFAIKDVSSRVDTENQLRRSEERFRTAFDLAPVGMALMSVDGRFIQGNNSLLQMLGCLDSEFDGMHLHDITLPEDLLQEQALLRDLLTNQSPFVQFEKRCRASNDRLLWTLVSVSLLRQGDMAMCYLYQFHEITARKQAEQQLIAQARRDALTNLPNRAALTSDLRQWLDHGLRRGQAFAVLFIDLDGFKKVNDTHGHAAGDQVLRVAAQRMQRVLSSNAVVGRWGGDEFVALVDNVASADDVTSLTRKLAAEFDTAITLENAGIARIGLSIGVSLYPSDGEDVEALLHSGDQALYRAKTEGRGQTRFYAEGIKVGLRERHVQAQELAWAMGDMALRLAYQPGLQLSNAKRSFSLASLLWTDPSGKPWQEDELRDLALDAGLSQRLDEWMLRQVCADAAMTCPPDGLLGGVTLKLSRQTLYSGTLAATLTSLLREVPLSADQLRIDLQASLLVTEDEVLVHHLRDVQSLGVTLAAVETGSQPINLHMLSRVGANALYVSAQIWRDPIPGEAELVQVEALVGLSKGLRLPIVARGHIPVAWRAALLARGCQLEPLEHTTFYERQPSDSINKEVTP